MNPLGARSRAVRRPKIWQSSLWGGPKSDLQPKTRISGHQTSPLSRGATQRDQTKPSATYMGKDTAEKEAGVGFDTWLNLRLRLATEGCDLRFEGRLTGLARCSSGSGSGGTTGLVIPRPASPVSVCLGLAHAQGGPKGPLGLRRGWARRRRG